LFRRVRRRSFALTRISETLLKDTPGSLRPLALLGGHPSHWRAWGEVLHAVKSGEAAFEHANGVDFFECMAVDDSLATCFREVMHSVDHADEAVLDCYDFSSVWTVVDVGGGGGELLGRILDRYPLATGILLDRPEVIRKIPRRPRVKLAAGDFFKAVPAGGDVYLLKFVLHDWDDRRAVSLLKRCRSAMRPTGRLLVVEVLLPGDNRPSVSRTHDVNMLVLTGGRERTSDPSRSEPA
jgi:hypothetical protein